MSDDTGDLMAAIAEFKAALPGWWYSLGSCSVSRDASCGPDRNGGHNQEILNRFDYGFHWDDHLEGSTMADALRNVTRQAVEAKGKQGGS